MNSDSATAKPPPLVFCHIYLRLGLTLLNRRIKKETTMDGERFIEGEMVYLNPLREDNLYDLISIMNNEDIRLFARIKRDIVNETKMRERIKEIQKSDEGFLIYRNIDNEILGDARIVNIDKDNRTAMIGISIKKKEERGKGYGSESIKLLLKHAFINMNLEAISLCVYEYNKVAIKTYEKIGFKYVGKKRNAKRIGNRIFGELLMDMVSDEYFDLYGNSEMKKYGIQ